MWTPPVKKIANPDMMDDDYGWFHHKGRYHVTRNVLKLRGIYLKKRSSVFFLSFGGSIE